MTLRRARALGYGAVLGAGGVALTVVAALGQGNPAGQNAGVVSGATLIPIGVATVAGLVIIRAAMKYAASEEKQSQMRRELDELQEWRRRQEER